MDENADPRTQPDFLARAAEEVLHKALNGAMRLGEPEMLREQGRNRVARFPVLEGPEGAPASVVVKTAIGEGEGAYDPAGGLSTDANRRFFNEWAGNRFLTDLGLSPGLGARLYGGSRETGVIVLEDLGAPRSLADHMLAEGRDALETALGQYAASMGRLHAATIGRRAGLDRIRLELANVTAQPEAPLEDYQKQIERFREQCTALGVMPASGFDADVEEVLRALVKESEPFLVFKPGDTCPDNHRLMDDGWARFFDFEFAGFGHALLDAAYFYMPFPTCWCVNRLPDEQIARMETIYRRELASGFPPALDDAVFLPALAAACAYWAMATLAWGMEGALKDDGKWGISTIRQRHPLRLENFAEVTERAGTLPAIAKTCRALAAHLRSLWPDTEPMPVYPAFRETAESSSSEKS